jgi:hypothetical protein
MPYPVDSPLWAVDDITFDDGTPNKVRPKPELRQYGYAPESFPTAQELNWQLNNMYLQLQELKTQVSNPSQLPVGFVMTMTGDPRNPSQILGYGTWQRFAEGRVVIGAGTTTDDAGKARTFSDGNSLGEFEHTLSEAEMPVHGHSGGLTGPAGGSQAKIEGYVQGAPKSDNYVPTTTGNAGGNQAHNNIQPSIAAFMWRRTA